MIGNMAGVVFCAHKHTHTHQICLCHRPSRSTFHLDAEVALVAPARAHTHTHTQTHIHTHTHTRAQPSFASASSIPTPYQDHFTESASWSVQCNCTDRWNQTAPRYGSNDSYNGYVFTDRAVQLIEQHDQSRPFFLYHAVSTMRRHVCIEPNLCFVMCARCFLSVSWRVCC